MPISPCGLLESCDLNLAEQRSWRDTPARTCPGVYLVALTDDPNDGSIVLPEAPVDLNALDLWIDECPEMKLNRERPLVGSLSRYLSSYWLPGETVLYVGMATSLQDRIGKFFSHRLGRSSPHRGGHWLKALSNLSELSIFTAMCESVDDAGKYESRLIEEFISQIPEVIRNNQPNPQLPLPYANLEWRTGGRKLRKQKSLTKQAIGS